MGPGSRLREFIPVLLAVILVASFLALLFELVIASARAVPLDPVATPALAAIVGACIPALAAFWAIESKPRNDAEPPASPRTTLVEPTGDEESDDWNREHGWLESRWGRWMPC